MSKLSVAGIQARTLNSRFTRPLLLVRNRTQSFRLFSDSGKGKEEGSMHLVKAGLPLFLFCGLGVWVVSNGIDGKNRERDAFQGRISKYVQRLSFRTAKHKQKHLISFSHTILPIVNCDNHCVFTTIDLNDKL